MIPSSLESDPIIKALLAAGRSPSIPHESDLFGHFVGAWDLEVEWLVDGRVTRHKKGEWVFSWILGGRAIQDVWTVPVADCPSKCRGSYECGTSLRFYDDMHGDWVSIWIGPVQNSVRFFRAKRRGSEIVLEGNDEDLTAIRWIFSDVERDTFRWRFERQKREGWITTQRFSCRRRAF